MPAYGAISRSDLIATLNKAGFEGPFSRGKHAIMRRGTVTVLVPNPHRGDISVGLVARILRQAGISRDEWERL